MSNEYMVSLIPWVLALTFGMVIFLAWMRERQFERHLRERQMELDMERVKREEERRREELDEVRYRRYEQEQKAEEEAVRSAAGPGTGGYIVVDLPDDRHPLFHDLLKGFEDYARLKGYRVSFSVDATFKDRIAFKFTLTDPGVVVGTERVRQDLKEYLDRIKRGDSLDDLPVITSIEEHEVVVTTLKNRLSFLQHSYNLAKNAAEFYEGLIRKASTMPVLPAQNIVVQTGGALTAPTYSAISSPQALIGDRSRADHSIRIALSFKERQEQIQGIEELLVRLRNELPDDHRNEVVRNLENVKDELEQSNSPEPSRVAGWLEQARQALQLGSSGYETVQAAKELFRLFGIG